MIKQKVDYLYNSFIEPCLEHIQKIRNIQTQ